MGCKCNRKDVKKREWIEVISELPPEEVVVETKIHNREGCRNECELMRRGNLWFFPDDSMYVYYTPTHWRNKREMAT